MRWHQWWSGLDRVAFASVGARRVSYVHSLKFIVSLVCVRSFIVPSCIHQGASSAVESLAQYALPSSNQPTLVLALRGAGALVRTRHSWGVQRCRASSLTYE